MRFPTSRSLVDWGVGVGDMHNGLKATETEHWVKLLVLPEDPSGPGQGMGGLETQEPLLPLLQGEEAAGSSSIAETSLSPYQKICRQTASCSSLLHAFLYRKPLSDYSLAAPLKRTTVPMV